MNQLTTAKRAQVSRCLCGAEAVFACGLHVLPRRRLSSANPMESPLSNSHIERSNLTLRMQNRRMTRLTNALSKSPEHHAHALALMFMFYNFARPHQTLTKVSGQKLTPAMAAGVADHVWPMEEIVGLLN